MFVIILVLCVLISTINSTVFITKTHTSPNGNRTRTTVCMSYPNLELAMKLIDPLVKIYIPCFIMIGLNIKVILSLRKSKQRAIRGRGVRNNVSKFAVSTILIDLFFFIFKSPEAILKIYLYLKTTGEVSYFSFENVKIIPLVTEVFTDFAFCYSVVLFIIFFIFNRLFRKELIRFFKIDSLLSVCSSQLYHFSSRVVT